LRRIKKINIQDPEPKSGCVRFGNGGIVRSRVGINKRNGHSTLFAAPDIRPATVTTTAMACRRKRRF
jgi:hypothetical protein